MSKTVTATEAKNNFGELMKWTSENEGGVLIKHYGEPAAALVNLKDYEILQEAKSRFARQDFAAALRQLRQSMQMNLRSEDTDEESYRQSGFSEEAIEEILALDKQIEAEQRQSGADGE